MMLLINLLQANQPKGGFDISFLIMMIAIFAIMYFFMIRPQQKKQKEIQKFRNALTVGSEVVTFGGIHGVIKSMDEGGSTVMLEIASGVKIKVEKTHIFPDAAATQNVK